MEACPSTISRIKCCIFSTIWPIGSDSFSLSDLPHVTSGPGRHPLSLPLNSLSLFSPLLTSAWHILFPPQLERDVGKYSPLFKIVKLLPIVKTSPGSPGILPSLQLHWPPVVPSNSHPCFYLGSLYLGLPLPEMLGIQESTWLPSFIPLRTFFNAQPCRKALPDQPYLNLSTPVPLSLVSLSPQRSSHLTLYAVILYAGTLSTPYPYYLEQHCL